MKKLTFFLKLNYKNKDKARGLLLFLVFVITACMLSTTLLIRKNNNLFYEIQLNNILKNDIYQTNTSLDLDFIYKTNNPLEFIKDFRDLSDGTNTVLSVFSILGIIILACGALVLLIFRDLSMQKSYAICKIYGMRVNDIYYKTLLDIFIYGILSGVIGSPLGYLIFYLLSEKMTGIDAGFSFLSYEILSVIFMVILMLAIVSGISSLIAGMLVFDKKIVNVLYERREKIKYKNTIYIAFAGLIFCYITVRLSFSEDVSYFKSIIIIIAVLTVMLLLVYYIIFKIGTDKYRNRKNLQSVKGLSFRFFCARFKKDAILAATVSVWAILICFIMNLEFNFSSTVREVYRDNLGYSMGIVVYEPEDRERIEHLLDKNEHTYTQLYSKLMNYSDLNGYKDTEGMLYIALIGKQTDNNEHFFVEKGTFNAEIYTINHCNLKIGNTYNFFGNELNFMSEITDNQYLQIIGYNIILNAEDYKDLIDNSWRTFYLLDISKSQEKELAQLLADEPCEILTSSNIVDDLNNTLTNYLLFVAADLIMLLVVTGTIFYAIIRNDIEERSKELYLYKIFGASEKEAISVIFNEYIMVAVTSSVSSVLVIMILGEIYFWFMSVTHYRPSVIAALSTLAAVYIFVKFICLTARRAARSDEGVGYFRDE